VLGLSGESRGRGSGTGSGDSCAVAGQGADRRLNRSNPSFPTKKNFSRIGQVAGQLTELTGAAGSWHVCQEGRGQGCQLNKESDSRDGAVPGAGLSRGVCCTC